MDFSSSNTQLLSVSYKIHFSKSQSFPWSQCQYSGSFGEVLYQYQGRIFLVAICAANIFLCGALKLGPHPGGRYEDQGGPSFYVGDKGMVHSVSI